MIKRLLLSIFIFCMMAVLAGGGIAYLMYQKALTAPLKSDGNDLISVKRGANITSIAQELKKRGIIANDWVMMIYARSNGLAHKIKAGDYAIHADETLPELLQNMVDGKVIAYNLTVVEGKTFQDLLTMLAENPNIKQTLTGKTAAEIAQQLNIEEGHPEGWFLPETYQFHRGTTDVALLQRMQQAMQKYLAEAWKNRSADLPLTTPYEALILASIVEKETGVSDERQQVAGVFSRRLKKGMLLQTDPSVIYGAHNYHGVITREHLQTDTPYNTYTRKGLPPTPIALPSKASIDAALHPDDGDALYFVANGEGGHTFSKTYEEHKKAVAAYRQWLKKQQ